MESNKTIVGKCPLCGKDVVKTLRGYACSGIHETPQSCRFFIFSTHGNRQFSDTEISDLLANRQILLDGFVTKDRKAYTSILRINQEGAFEMSSLVGKCPVCGGDMYVSDKNVYCSHFREQSNPCGFFMWRNIGGHQLSVSEIIQILTSGRTESPVTVYDSTGNSAQRHIGIASDKQVTILNEN